jgi:hypothetical protein
MNAALDTAAAPTPRSRGGGSGRRVRVFGFIAGITLTLLAVAAALTVVRALGHDTKAAAKPVAAVPAAWVRPAVSSAGLVDRTGVKITQVAVTGGGGLIDLRYQVIDPNKAARLHDANNPPAVVDEQTGVVAHDLFMQHSHSGPFAFGETYYLVFDNPGNLVRRGGFVTVLLGDAQVDHVLVR